jgi:hypothetical protein
MGLNQTKGVSTLASPRSRADTPQPPARMSHASRAHPSGVRPRSLRGRPARPWEAPHDPRAAGQRSGKCRGVQASRQCHVPGGRECHPRRSHAAEVRWPPGWRPSARQHRTLASFQTVSSPPLSRTSRAEHRLLAVRSAAHQSNAVIKLALCSS